MNSKIFYNWLNVSSKNFNRGINFGHKSIRLSKTSYWHPLMSDYLLGTRNRISFFSLQKTFKSLLRAFYVLASISKRKGKILVINTNPEFFRVCNNVAHLTLQGKYALLESKSRFFKKLYLKKKVPHYQQMRTPLISYVNYKWIGGTLTNWKQISKSVLNFAKFSERCERFLQRKGIEFPKYTRVKKCFQGLLYKHEKKNTKLLAFKQKPDLIFLINPNENQIVLQEAYHLDIPVIAFAESNTNPKGITYPIPVNNFSVKFIYYCLKKIIKSTHLADINFHKNKVVAYNLNKKQIRKSIF